MKRIGVLTSGGDAPGMNAAIRAVVRQALHEGLKVTGILRGYTGMINGEFMEFDSQSVADIIHRGGTILHTARCQEMYREEGRLRAVTQLQAAGIEGLVVIGGDGSFRGALHLHELGIPIIGIPGTIDNDINGTEYTLGFDTAVNTVVEAINKIRDTANSLERIFLIEVMGRHSGQLALAAGIAGGAEAVLVPEQPFVLEELVTRLQRSVKREKPHSIILVAEGVGSATAIGDKIKEIIGLDNRVTVLGHVQRGGTPTALDRLLASRFGTRAVEELLAGHSGMMIGIRGDQVISIPLADVVGRSREINSGVFELMKVLAL